MDRNYINIITILPRLFGIWRIAKKSPHSMRGLCSTICRDDLST